MICEMSVCCGCGLCVYSCKFQAVCLKEDEEGFLYPWIDKNKCVNCGICQKMCPAINNNLSTEKLLEKERTFAGYNSNLNELLKSSSGGAGHAIACAILRQGGIVFGVRFNENYRGASYTQITTFGELEVLRGSKYIESDRSILFERIEEAIKTGKKILVIGLPCDIAAVRSLVGVANNLYTCKLICRSNTSNRVLRQYLEKCEHKEKSSIQRLSLRYKKRNVPMLPTKIKIEYENGNISVEDFTKTDFGKAFQIMARPSCLQCNYKNIDGIADLTIGDFQGLTGEEEYYNINGVSLICEHTEKGKELLGLIDNFYLYEVPYKEVMQYNWMIKKSIPKSPFRDEFSYYFRKDNLSVSCCKLRDEQNKILDQIRAEFLSNKYRTAIWGIGDTNKYLFERLQMDKWNIIGVFDSSLLKIGKKFKQWQICDIKSIPAMKDQIDVLVVMIPSEEEKKLDLFLNSIGWDKRVIHVGKYKFYRG